jgi:hypothetical protein
VGTTGYYGLTPALPCELAESQRGRMVSVDNNHSRNGPGLGVPDNLHIHVTTARSKIVPLLPLDQNPLREFQNDGSEPFAVGRSIPEQSARNERAIWGQVPCANGRDG